MKKRNLLLVGVLMAGVLGLVMSALVVGLLGLAWSFAPSPVAAAQSAAPAATPAAAPMLAAAPANLASMDAAFEQIYNQVNPSVVTINVVQKQAVDSSVLPFFGVPQSQLPQYQYQQALGSGFVWDAQGDIVTNNHVIDGADRISVTFSDGTVVSGKVIGKDPSSDLAVVKVNAPAGELHPAQMGDSTTLKVGQLAIAIGNPFGEQSTMTTGIISALGRSLPAGNSAAQGPSYSIPDVIQTDAPINPGNSGGVLLNDQGRVVGVTSAIESPVRASSGIGFAIPAAIVGKVVPTLIKTGHYDHPWLGISGTSLDPTLDKAMGLKSDQRGALVVDVTPGSPADKAGLRSSTRQITIDGQKALVGGDVITAINGQSVQSFDDMVAYLARSTDVGQTITLTILRDGKEQTVQMTLTARPNSTTQQSETGTSQVSAP